MLSVHRAYLQQFESTTAQMKERQIDRTVPQRQTEYIESTVDYDNELRRKIDEIGEATRKTEEEFNDLKEIDTMLLYLSAGGWNDVDERKIHFTKETSRLSKNGGVTRSSTP